MIPQELITRTKTNLEWLAEKYPEKFTIYLYENTSRLLVSEFMLNIPNGYRRGLLAFKRDGTLLVSHDPQQQFSNSIGRIFWEAWDERLILESYTIMDENDFCYIFNGLDVESTEELSAQLESLNLRIEQERKN
jgi:hypothetical protein